ncbi:hypothetical protein SAPIO_CDS0199 [Scedosporium apiospermum]|uniref:2'-phosphotransferase n=1 Tax=Pseudallescheria apiosperma TaxID=563466 RepID=A0A084GHQ9_PSEDA|nr:uncharacterized protein SAPIO_CDS0199 [Scedosporium apiospermum]KEZ46871.1 hypothetical protein SAPIO_CDS0199 [Scedosporium apiospermum]
MADTTKLEEGAYAKAERGEGRSGRGRGRGRGGGGGGMKREVQVSKALSRLLRHQAENAGVKLDESGYAELDKVMAWQPLRSLQVTFEDISTVVQQNDKQRFSMLPNETTNPSLDSTSTDPSHWLIRANQGHSIALSSSALMQPITLESQNVPEVVVHGTYFAFWPLIVESGGLKPMGRTHVHFATGLPGPGAEVVSGMRRDAELLVYVDVERSLRDGVLKWWVSENGVVLTEGGDDGLVPLRYFREVVGRRTDVGVLVKDGEVLGGLPEGVKGVVPPGKGRGRRGGGGGGRGGSRA